MRARSERGGGAVLTIGVALVLFSVAAAAVVVVGWFGNIRHAEQVAELAALAGVSAAVRGDDPCGAARAAAAHNGAELSHCQVRGRDADVVLDAGVTVALEPAFLGAPSTVERRATAGTM
ncbi:Rv3654c family TadE-like protein [Tessaracoccus oleiagri]|uniref:Helicase/secretion neighborhood TadE-like protein n=1 Tax=Tessaracoccus oleiagri TaxID=686624 RepID=A0A1G9MYT5_9ACTN|nr:Rv3654c family TadE-like protein [Tessaracoccus oleiagri]SDL79389.1 helicase/secretion neighborhood TadE-like protein [Tessaracoccus oleiagri]